MACDVRSKKGIWLVAIRVYVEGSEDKMTTKGDDISSAWNPAPPPCMNKCLLLLATVDNP